MKSNVSPVKAFFRNKWVRLVLAIDAVVLVALLVVLIMNAMKTSVISFDVTPIDAKILVNGSEYTNGSYRFAPGTYEIVASHEGMATKSFTVELGDDSIVNLATFLVGEDGGFGFYELRENYNSYVKLAEMASVENNLTVDHDVSAEEFITEFQKDYGIFEILPIVDRTPSKYGLEAGVAYQYDMLMIQEGLDVDECLMTLCLYATDTLGGREDYVKEIVNNFGYDAGDFQIVYEVVGYEN